MYRQSYNFSQTKHQHQASTMSFMSHLFAAAKVAKVNVHKGLKAYGITSQTFRLQNVQAWTRRAFTPQTPEFHLYAGLGTMIGYATYQAGQQMGEPLRQYEDFGLRAFEVGGLWTLQNLVAAGLGPYWIPLKIVYDKGYKSSCAPKK